MRKSRRQGLKAPIRVGEEYTVKIEAIGSKGDGLTRIKGFVVFVPGSKVGEVLKVRIDRVLDKFAVASTIE